MGVGEELSRMISKVIHFLETGIWQIRLKDLSAAKRFPLRYLRVGLLAIQNFYKDECHLKASALTYYSLLSVVPIVALVFGIAKGFGLEKVIQGQIAQLAQKGNWQPGVVDQIIAFSHSLLENAKGGLIAGVGVILVLWTVISILGHIEDFFNDIWEVKKSRTLRRKFGDYISMMILAPILQIVSSSAAVVVASRLNALIEGKALGAFGDVIGFLLQLLPYVSMWTLLTLLYVLMPNRKVPLKSGITAGIITGTIFQIVQWIYIKFQIGVASYGAIYGSFAALPLFLAWLQLSWLIVLFGAEIAYADENDETFGYHPDYSKMSIASKKLFVLRIYHLLVKTFDQGLKPLTARQIAYTLEIPVRLVRQLLEELTSAGVVVETVGEGSHGAAFQPGKTIEQATVKYAIDVYEHHGVEPRPASPSEEGEKILRSLQSISEAIEKSPGNIALKEI